MALNPITTVSPNGSINHHLSRRTFLRTLRDASTGVALAALAGGNVFAMEPNEKASSKPIVFVRFDGGASLFDTFEMEPHSGVDRIYEPIGTSVTGLKISQGLPQLARQMDKMMLIKSLAHNEGNHFHAQAIMTIGNHEEIGGENSLNYRDPGRFIELRKQQLPPEGLSVVVLNSSYGFTNPIGLVDGLELHAKKTEKGDYTNPFGNAPELAARRPVVESLINDFESAVNVTLPETESFVRSRSAGFRTLEKDLGGAFNLDTASSKDRERYGVGELGTFAKAALIARRLVEKNVPVISIAHGDFDYHSGIKRFMDGHLPKVDKPLAALIEDVDALGGIVVFTTEFARTPKINGGNGRDHWPGANFGAISGLNPGRVVGKIDSGGKAVYPLPAEKLLPTAIYAAGYKPLYVRANGGVLTQVKVDGFNESELST